MELATFFLTATVLAITPGADMLYVATRTTAGGFRAGLASSVGIAVGALGHTLAAALGVSSIFFRSPTLFAVLVWVGAAYLIYLGIGMLRTAPDHPRGEVAPSPLWHVFREAVAVNALNPKVSLFFVGFLPQFVDPVSGSVPLQMIVLGTAFNAMGTTVNIGVAAGTGSLRTRLSEPSGGWPRRVSGLLLIGLGIVIAVARRW